MYKIAYLVLYHSCHPGNTTKSAGCGAIEPQVSEMGSIGSDRQGKSWNRRFVQPYLDGQSMIYGMKSIYIYNNDLFVY